MDGNITIYDNQYSNAVDWNDGTKMNNPGENWGLLRSNVSLMVERRQAVVAEDTAFFNMWGMQIRNYRFEVTAENFNPLTQAAYVWDDYLHAITPIDFSGITTVNFSVDANPGSKAAHRFQLRYTTPANYQLIYNALYGVLPVTFTGISAERKADAVAVNWNVENEINITDYSVQRSSDAIHFNAIKSVKSLNNSSKSSYTYLDEDAGTNQYYYHIVATGKGGEILYSNTVKILKIDNSIKINVYPNPVENKIVHIKWNSLQTDKWSSSLIYSNGKKLPLENLTIPSGQSSSSIQLPASLTTGVYQLLLINSSGKIQSISIIVL
jgi:hypothetical protein